MKISQKGIDLIKQFEGCKLTAYKCPSGVWTIGYGHTKGVYEGQKITQKQAEKFLKEDLKAFEKGVNKCVLVSINQNQFDALVSFAFNCGTGAFSKSTLLEKLNQKDYTGAAREFLRWNKSNGVILNGLVRRRNAERKLFSTNIDVHVVQKGDTLSAIAQRYNTTVKVLAKLNDVKDPDLIYVGQKIKLP